MITTYHPEFLTATILDWKHLLDDEFKQTIVDAMEWLVKEKRCMIYGFFIMPNHIHLLWKIEDGFDRGNVQGALLSYTAHIFKKKLSVHNPNMLASHRVNLSDRSFQFWQRDCMVKECWSEWFLEEKLNYIHQNPLQEHWQLSNFSENYYWSSASFYIIGTSPFSFLAHYKD